MLGVLINAAAVIVGSLVGLIFKKGISKRFADAVMIGVGLCVIYIGISGALKGENPLILIGSMFIGAIIGTWIDIDKRITNLGNFIENRFKKPSGDTPSITQGLVTASLLFCIGAMAIIGSLDAGLTGNYDMLLTKSMLDLISAAILSVTLGIGVIFSAGIVLIYQGAIVLLAQLLQPILTESAVAEITCAGSLMIIALGLNIIGVTKIKVANYLPAIIIAPIICWIVELI